MGKAAGSLSVLVAAARICVHIHHVRLVMMMGFVVLKRWRLSQHLDYKPQRFEAKNFEK